jgi:hypothetical protein
VRIIDFRESYFRVGRGGMLKFSGIVMILPVVVAEFKLRAEFITDKTFGRVELVESLGAMPAVIIAALIDGDLCTVFPFKEGMMAVWAVVFGCIIFAESFIELKEVIADLA